ncbi:hypothetical protein JKP88DRAFT_240952 [Tribonema minus]|uniref:Uncharacterized protein n=1 Tax=Tribonema minus TaxID=303371 RepID=A0A835Z7F9_9STRA|nr:hypothetical protein JKP88DRAFT_240952 [Tribonema minus]
MGFKTQPSSPVVDKTMPSPAPQRTSPTPQRLPSYKVASPPVERRRSNPVVQSDASPQMRQSDYSNERRRERRRRRENRHRSKYEEVYQRPVTPPPQLPPSPPAPQQQMFHEEMNKVHDEFDEFRRSNQRESESIEKAELLAIMNQLEREGFPPTKRMSSSTPLDDIRYEVYRQKRDANRQKSLKSMRNYLVTASSILEMVNDTCNPFELNLNGFSSSVMLNIEDYDSSLLELHHKYSGRGSNWSPEVKLAMSLTFAAIVHHTSGVASRPRERGGDVMGGVKRMAGGGGAGGLFAGLNPFSMLSSLMRGNATTVPAAPASSMRGPPPTDTESD